MAHVIKHGHRHLLATEILAKVLSTLDLHALKVYTAGSQYLYIKTGVPIRVEGSESTAEAPLSCQRWKSKAACVEREKQDPYAPGHGHWLRKEILVHGLVFILHHDNIVALLSDMLLEEDLYIMPCW